MDAKKSVRGTPAFFCKGSNDFRGTGKGRVSARAGKGGVMAGAMGKIHEKRIVGIDFAL
jgi:hypothetical protein